MKQIIDQEKMSKSQALIFSEKCFSHLNSKKKGEQVTCPCCGKDLITGNSKWTQHNAAIKAWITIRNGCVRRSDAARKANQTRKIKSKSAEKIKSKIHAVQEDPMKGRTENDLIRNDLLLEWID